MLTTQPLGRTGRLVSPAGFGSYRVDTHTPEHYQALRYALQKGVNLIDTSSNYGDGRSEELIGQVVQELITAGQLCRADLVIVSKVGYLQGQNYLLSQQRQAENRPFPDLVPYSNGLEHCIHPEFIADQLTRSLQRLNTDFVDVYLLHNPEYYLSWAKKMGIDPASAQAEYDRRIKLAFAYLEQEVTAGRIKAYGVSSNTFPAPAESYEFTSLARLWEIAQNLTPNHHFQVIQLPFNLLETGAVTEANQPNGQTVLELAHALSLGVLVNRPLNALVEHNLVRLASRPGVPAPPSVAEVNTAVSQVAELENQLNQAIFDTALPFRTKQEFSATLASGRLLKERWQGFGSDNNWQDIRDGYVLPRSQMGLRFLGQRPESSPDMKQLGELYGQALQKAVNHITVFYAHQAGQLTEQLTHNINHLVPDWAAATLSQTAVRAVRSTAGVSCVLVGMRHEAYVDDVLAELARPWPEPTGRETWLTVKKALL